MHGVPIVFCDSGGLSRWVQKLDREGKIIAKMGLYEQRSPKVGTAKPSEWTLGNPHITLDNPDATLSDTSSAKLADINGIIRRGGATAMDGLQLDSAYISGAAAFVTSDKRDIVTHRAELELLLGMKIFHSDEEAAFVAWLGSRA